MDDLAVLDGDCEEIIKQGKLPKCRTQINNSFIPIVLLWIRERPFVFNCDRYTAFHCSQIPNVQLVPAC